MSSTGSTKRVSCRIPSLRRGIGLGLALGLLASGCVHARQGSGAGITAVVDGDEVDGRVAEAEQALSARDGARAIALFTALLGREDLTDAQRARIYPGLARANEFAANFEAAVQSYEAAVALAAADGPAAEGLATLWANKGAAEAELERWDASAASFESAIGALSTQALPSTRVEYLARQALAYFAGDRLEDCLASLDRSEAIYAESLAQDTERFSTFYFVGMMRFYRAAVLHAQFRAVEVALPETRMAKDFDQKLKLLVQAQEAYNATIETKHVYWVSAAGYQLGHLFEEFYDDLMRAPVPDWLDEPQRRVYYEELKTQLRPVVNKAIWVFERNLEAARRLGYETEFTQDSEAALARLQAILLSGDTDFGEPHPQLALSSGDAQDPQQGGQSAQLPTKEQKLFLPPRTPL